MMISKYNYAIDLSLKNSHGKSKVEFIKCIIQDDETLNIYEKIFTFMMLQGVQIEDENTLDKELIEHTIQNDKSLNQPEKILFLDLVQRIKINKFRIKALKRALNIIDKSKNDWNYQSYAIQNDEFLNQYEKIFVLAMFEKYVHILLIFFLSH
ncbi:hypothetical protein C2G38_431896 [Gigaspora rosea]|uniref:Uncharacterized protein n=1 Tax=Gigaspora rosea TaxID=44941 RepID=A0A397VV82_9GLOM|nr:hypothetical protein C2G38_431896 [Gigaspora rosea]